MRSSAFLLAISTLILLGAAACGSYDLPSPFAPSNPYDAYAHSLETALTPQAMEHPVADRWRNAGETAVSRPVEMSLPFRESIYLVPHQVRAVAYRLQLLRGQDLVVRLQAPEDFSAECFLDLFVVAGDAGSGNSPRPVARAKKGANTLQFNVRRSGTYVLRLQPELAARGLYTLDVAHRARMTFPVADRDADAIGSVFGDPRSGGRKHDGVDIFAPRGTPALAATDGRITKVGTNRLGGNVVWMRGDGLSFYYAHLETQRVSAGAAVRAGDVIGTVGNSGNAKTTPPHLHFGIYDGGAVDPAPFLKSSRPPAAVEVDVDWLEDWARIRGRQVNLRQGPSTQTAILDALPRGTVVDLVGAHRGWFRAELPDGRQGFLFGSLVEPAAEPLRRLTIDSEGRSVQYRPAPDAAVAGHLASGERVDVLGTFGDYVLVRRGVANLGWITVEPLQPAVAPAVAPTSNS